MIVDTVAYFALAFFILFELQMLAIGIVSIVALRKDRFSLRYSRIDDMLSSDLSPPVSIIVPAFNEAAGIVASVRSMTMLRYPRLEIVVVNDGSTDDTLRRLVDAFRLRKVTAPIRKAIETSPIRGIYRPRLPVPVIVVDKENGGSKADALNAGINVARYPYVLLTDADMVMDPDCVLRAMRRVVEDRVRTVAVGGNVRPINGCTLDRGQVVDTRVPEGTLQRLQVLEYVRSFIAARPGWSMLNGLVLLSGAFGLYSREVVTEVGGLRGGHLGEDMDLTMRIHKHLSEQGRDYRIVYAPDAVAWTEVPTTRKVLRRQRIRWHRGLTMVVKDFKGLLFNPRYGRFGTLGWPAFFLFEFVAPIVEAAGWIVVPIALVWGSMSWTVAAAMFAIAFFIGTVNSLLALFMDESFGYFTRPLDALRLLGVAFIENLGLRQQTVVWRMRALFMSNQPPSWGDMERRGVANLG